MTKDLPKVTFGITNCNRLYYLQSCLESLLYCTEDYPNKEIIIIDNASIEKGTDEYLKEKESQGHTVVRQLERDPANEFAKALNIVANAATGDFICPLQGDMQFIIKSQWLHKYVEYYTKHHNNLGCIMLDAQRNITNKNHAPYGITEEQKTKQIFNKDYEFVLDLKRNPVSGAGDVMYSKAVLEKIAPWVTSNDKHEGGEDSETKMLQKVQTIIQSEGLKLYTAVPMIPPAAAIFTDPRGTNARVRGMRRYGKYFAPKQDFMYYKVHNYDDALDKFSNSTKPIGLEDIITTIGYPLPIDQYGQWLKNPIDPATATKNDYVELEQSTQDKVIVTADANDYISQWLDD